jgi:hypothetical protein
MDKTLRSEEAIKPRPIQQHVVSVRHETEKPLDVASFLEKTLGFVLQSLQGNQVTVTNGALTLHLSPAPSTPQRRLTLEVACDDLGVTLQRLEEHRAVLDRDDEQWIDDQRIEMWVRSLHGLDLILVQELTEDDLDILPPLPSRLPWTPPSDRLIRRILRRVPLPFRPGARRRATARAEFLTVSNGSLTVDLRYAVQGLLEATPSFQHETLRQALLEEGVDPEQLVPGTPPS